MKETKCKTCYYKGYVGGYICCDYMLVTGAARTARMTPKEKKEPCKEYLEGKRPRIVSRILIEAW